MGNGIGKLSLCFAGDAGDISRRRNDIAVCLSDPLDDQGLGHSYCYIPSDLLHKSQTLLEDSSAVAAPQTAVFRTISGAAISANASTPLSTDAFAYTTSTSLDKASSFESSSFFSSTPLQPIPRNSFHTANSGPIPRNSVTGSGPIDRGFLSGPIERSFDTQFDQLHRCRPKSKKLALLRSFEKVLEKSFWSLSKELNMNERENNSNSGNSSRMTSNNLSSEMSLGDDNDEVDNEAFRAQNVQWAQGKAGEDRVHIVISEDQGWVFVGIYDGFNGPDATDFLLNNLYSNVYKELKGLLWSESFENSTINNGKVDHLGVLKGLSEALRRTEESYLDIADLMLMENPELALMGSCVLVMVMKGDDVYLMNVGDSRAVLAEKKPDQISRKESSQCGYEYEKNVHVLTSSQLTMDHTTSVREEVRRIRYAHNDDPSAVVNERVKGSLKVTRAFGAGFLKQPKWNNALLEMFRIEYIGSSPYITCSPFVCHRRLDMRDKFLILSSDGLYQYFTNEEAVSEVEMFMSMFPEGDPAQHLVEQVLLRAAKKAGIDFYDLLDIPQGDRRRYHDDVSIIIISFEPTMLSSPVLC